MRTSYENQILRLNNKVVGVCLGADYCAEHEWGIKRMLQAFGIQSELSGLEKRRTTKCPATLKWVEIPKSKTNPKMEGLYWNDYDYKGDGPNVTRLQEFRSAGRSSELPSTAWSESGFFVASDKPEQIKVLRDVFDAFQKNDIAIWLGGGGVFKNSGLCFGVASRLPAEITDNWLAVDQERELVQKRFADSGIEKILADAGKKYFALSPKKDDKEEGGIIMWLKPYEQQKYNYGYFNLQQLRQWAKDEGPIPMKNNNRDKRR